ncbi:MAG: glycosyltransferase family 4 protein [Gemmatimonadetes bacterium]|nr:glycosyltransferase family 4 protein [Gemmatimonadota bacterium]
MNIFADLRRRRGESSRILCATLSIVKQFRRHGDVLSIGDGDLRGIPRGLAAAATFSPSKPRWVARYHLGAVPFALRSRAASAALAARGADAELVLQFGATFSAPSDRPYFLYCDSNIRVAERGRSTGVSWAAALSPAEVEAVSVREASVYRGARAIFTISEHLRQSFIGDFAIPADRVHAVLARPNFDQTHIQPRTTAPSSPPTILFVGAHFERKGGDLLLRAFARVRERIRDARLILIGPRDTSHGGPGVTNLGFLRKDVASEHAAILKAYQEAHVFCLPTRFEPFGIAYVEAAFMVFRVSARTRGRSLELILHGQRAIGDSEDEDRLTTRMLRLLPGSGARGADGPAGRAHAAATFSWERTVDRMRAVGLAALTYVPSG